VISWSEKLAKQEGEMKTLFIDGEPVINIDTDNLTDKGMLLLHLIEQAWPYSLPEYRPTEKGNLNDGFLSERF